MTLVDEIGENMNNILEEFRHRRSFISNMHYDEASSRLAGFLEWLEGYEQTRSIIEEVERGADINAMLSSNPIIPPSAFSPEDVAALGLHIIRQASQGKDLFNISHEYGIKPSFRTTALQDFSNEVMRRYVDPALDYIERIIEKQSQESDISNLLSYHVSGASGYPLEITESLKRFLKDYPEIRKNAFIMMKFGETKAHLEIVEAIRETLAKYGINALRADDKEYHEDLFPNVLTYIYGSRFGIAVFERLEQEEFNPNGSLEVGYMRALRKPVCLLKDQTLKTLQTDLVGKLYKSFDPQSPMSSIPAELEKWLRDKELIT